GFYAQSARIGKGVECYLYGGMDCFGQYAARLEEDTPVLSKEQWGVSDESPERKTLSEFDKSTG
ncbi:hypothetical protein O988_09460, partial [Pseudogymnoascus sp. VKM F-3808]